MSRAAAALRPEAQCIDRHSATHCKMPVAVPNREEIQRRIAGGANVWIAAGDGDIERVRFLMEHDGRSPRGMAEGRAS